MRYSRPWLFLFLLLLCSTQLVWARQARTFTPEPIDFARLLPPPPAPGSLQQRQEIERLLALQHARTPAMVAAVQADAARTVFRFADVMGPAFTPENLPLTAAFFDQVKKDARIMLGDAKEHWNRPRPSQTDPAIEPCIKNPHNASYPSGHSTYATVVSILLANMAPQKQAQIYERARQYRENREIAGVHFPSDVAAGRIAGTVIVARLFENPAFLREFAAATTEVRRVLGLSRVGWPVPDAVPTGAPARAVAP